MKAPLPILYRSASYLVNYTKGILKKDDISSELPNDEAISFFTRMDLRGFPIDLDFTPPLSNTIESYINEHKHKTENEFLDQYPSFDFSSLLDENDETTLKLLKWWDKQIDTLIEFLYFSPDENTESPINQIANSIIQSKPSLSLLVLKKELTESYIKMFQHHALIMLGAISQADTTEIYDATTKSCENYIQIKMMAVLVKKTLATETDTEKSQTLKHFSDLKKTLKASYPEQETASFHKKLDQIYTQYENTENPTGIDKSLARIQATKIARQLDAKSKLSTLYEFIEKIISLFTTKPALRNKTKVAQTFAPTIKPTTSAAIS